MEGIKNTKGRTMDYVKTSRNGEGKVDGKVCECMIKEGEGRNRRRVMVAAAVAMAAMVVVRD